jgi:hypothetical protein
MVNTYSNPTLDCDLYSLSLYIMLSSQPFPPYLRLCKKMQDSALIALRKKEEAHLDALSI